MKREINVFEYAQEILTAVNQGVLLTTKADGKVNSMSISWGTLGVEWNKPIFITFVRQNRFTKELLDKNPEFTINIPFEKYYDKKIIAFCGTKSGRDIDKIKELNLTTVESEKVAPPAFKELPLTLECKVIYKQMQDIEAISDENKKLHYPQNVDSSFHGSNRDVHTAYYGEIVSAYILED